MTAPHGTPTRYTAHRCRCPDCTTAQTAAHARARVSARARGLRDGDPRHGTVNGYNYWGCSCTDCRTANATRKRRYRATSR